MVITALTRNQVVAQAARGFESHPIRQKNPHSQEWGFLLFSLFTIHYSLFTLHYSLFTIHSSLFTLHYFPPFIRIFREDYRRRATHLAYWQTFLINNSPIPLSRYETYQKFLNGTPTELPNKSPLNLEKCGKMWYNIYCNIVFLWNRRISLWITRLNAYFNERDYWIFEHRRDTVPDRINSGKLSNFKIGKLRQISNQNSEVRYGTWK